jgi:hypothetical protein
MSRGGKLDALLERMMLGACGFLLLRPIVVGAWDRRYPRLAMGNAYPHRGVLEHAEAQVPFSRVG